LKKTFTYIIGALSASLLLMLNTANAAELTITKATIRLVPPVAETTAAYATLSNPGNQTITITNITAEGIAASASMHDMTMHNGMMHMAPLPSLSIPAGQTITLQSGGKHLMLEGLKHPLKPGESIQLVLTLSDSSQQTFTATVKDMRQDEHLRH